MSKYKEEDIEKAKELIRTNEYNICLVDHTDIKYMIEQTHIVGASDEELIKRAQEITEDCEGVKPFNPKPNKKVMYNESNCEWYSEGSNKQYENGGYELWMHKPTQKIIRVPIETIQVWDEAEESEDE